jgi:hypothetical protein
MMEKAVLFLFIFLRICNPNLILAQSAVTIPCNFTVTQSTPPAFPSAGAVNLSPVNINNWDTLINPVPGFSFEFGGINYTQFVVSTNGWSMNNLLCIMVI